MYILVIIRRLKVVELIMVFGLSFFVLNLFSMVILIIVSRILGVEDFSVIKVRLVIVLFYI